MIEHTATGRLVTLNGLNEQDKAHWPTLGHYIGTVGVLIAIHEDHSEGHKNNYEVVFDPSPSMVREEMLDRVWMVEQSELTFISIIPGYHATFRINEDSIPELVVVTGVHEVEGADFKLYDFIVMAGGQEFTNVPEQFLRPYPLITL